MRSITLLSGVTSTSIQTYVRIPRGRWSLTLTLAASNSSESVGLHCKQTPSGDVAVVSKSAAALAITEADPTHELRSGGELYAAKLDDGSQAATLIANYVGP